MPPSIKAAEFVAEGIERLAPEAVGNGLNLLEVAGEKSGLLKGATLKAVKEFLGGTQEQIRASSVSSTSSEFHLAIRATSEMPSAARTLSESELSQIALRFKEPTPETLANLPKPSLDNKIESPLHLAAVRDLTLHISDSSVPFEDGSNLLGKRFALKQDNFATLLALPKDLPRDILDKKPLVDKLLESRPADLSAYNRHIASTEALNAFDHELVQLARVRAFGFQSAMKPAFARLDLPAPRFFSSAPQIAAEASYTDGGVTMGHDFFLQPINTPSGALTVHEITHLDQFYLIACREADKLGIGTERATVNQLDKLSENLAKTQAFTQRTTEQFLTQRAGKQLSSAAADRADQLTDSVVSFFNYPVGQVEVANQVVAVDNFRSLLAGLDNFNISRSLLNRFHDPRKGPAMARALFGASDAEAERALITTTFPKSGLKSWSAEKSGNAEKFLDGAFDRAENTAQRLYQEVNENYLNTLHEREARFNEFIAKEVLKLHLPRS